MASSVFYKFASRKDESRVTFDGTGISVFDLKRDIILANNLGKANDFDLILYDNDTKEEFKDDSAVIPRSSFVIVKRVPAFKTGKGSKISMYLAGAANMIPTSEPVQRGFGTVYKGAMSKRFDGRDEQIQTLNAAPNAAPMPTNVAGEEEAAAMAAMFQAQTANWAETQEKMSHATRIFNNPRGTGFARGGKPHTPYQPERPLPASYVCYRCGQKGHWIKDCPTNSDREYDNKPRIKRTTGIPRSMLKAVENPNQGELTSGVMVTPEGGYVVAQPDLASWQKQVSRSKGLSAAEVRERAPSDSTLACPIDHKLFRDAVKTPCCGTLYCEDCIQTHLLERDFICPNCAKKIPSLDKLAADKETRTKVNDYIEKAIEESKKEDVEDQGVKGGAQPEDGINLDGDFYDESGMNMDMQQMIVDSIPQLQAQISQISVMLQNPLPPHVRQTTEMQHQQLKMQLQQAQAMSAALAAAVSFQQQQQQQGQGQVQVQQVQNVGGMGYGMQQGWTNPFPNQQPAGQDSAYQRLPLNNRRRNIKRERPSDFLEIGGESDSKVPRYWE
ncbi:Protein mpe1 [Marasmius tenuissimus]|nr:Protein mpe1 [Marasmius tenuissimus]